MHNLSILPVLLTIDFSPNVSTYGFNVTEFNNCLAAKFLQIKWQSLEP